jgi:hypothetical protein
VDVTFRELRRTEIGYYHRLRPDTPQDEIEHRFEMGYRCFTSWHGDELIDACWSATGTVYVPYLDRILEIPEGDVYSFDSFTVRAHRGHGVYMARNSYQARLNRQEGFRRSIALVARENHAAFLVLARSGLETLGTYHYLRTPVRGVYWSTRESAEPLPVLSAGSKASGSRGYAVSLAL